jgi:hypothetical protein
MAGVSVESDYQSSGGVLEQLIREALVKGTGFVRPEGSYLRLALGIQLARQDMPRMKQVAIRSFNSQRGDLILRKAEDFRV